MPKRKRDLVEEIVGKRQRFRRKGPLFTHAENRAFSLLITLLQLRDLRVRDNRLNVELKREMLRYFPVAMVACLETYYRGVIRDLIDQGAPYRDRATRLEELRLDLPTVLRMQEKRVTMGEFVSHLLPLSSVEDINRHMSVLLAVDYFSLVKKVELPRNLQPAAFQALKDEAWPALESLWQDRHIVSHEIHGPRHLTFKRAFDQSRAALFLLDANDLLQRHFHAPLDMQVAAG